MYRGGTLQNACRSTNIRRKSIRQCQDRSDLFLISRLDAPTLRCLDLVADRKSLDYLPFHARYFVQDNHKKRRGERSGITLRAAAKRALRQVLRPLSEFVVDAGLSTSEINSILRETAVRIIAERQLEVARRVNISGIAASTGISRADISRILKTSDKAARHRDDNRQQSTNSVLSAWHKEPRFTDPNGQPAELRLYGRGATFESLVKTHGRGIPTRAVLDELVRTRAVEVLRAQKIRAKTFVAIHGELDRQFIKMFGDRGSELLSAMLRRMRDPNDPDFLASVSGAITAPRSLPLIRREVYNKGAEFLAEIQESLLHAPSGTKGSRNVINVTVFCNERRNPANRAIKGRRVNRTNFRREP